MDNQRKIASLVDKMVELSEAEFTKIVLEPLFIAMGYKTDYHGGQNEGGKDLICWRDDDFGEKELTVIQVKKVSASAAAGSPSSFGEIVTQLSQALEKNVPNLDGTARRPDKVLFITPYEINTRALESRFEGYSQLRNRGARAYDGQQIAKQLIERKMGVVSELLGKEHEFRASPIAGFSNRDLLSALHYGKERSVRHFYTDLDFGIGKARTGTLLDVDFNPFVIQLMIDGKQWDSLKLIVNRLEQYFGGSCINPSSSEIEEVHKNNLSDWNSALNQQAIIKAKATVEEIKELIEGLLFSLEQISPEISSRQKLELNSGLGFRGGENVSRQDATDRDYKLIQAASNSNNSIRISCKEIIDLVSTETIDATTVKHLANAATKIKEQWAAISKFILEANIKSVNTDKESVDLNIVRFQSKTNELSKYIGRIVVEPKFKIEIDGPKLANYLRIEQKKLRKLISELKNSNQHERDRTQEVFRGCFQTLQIVDEIFSDSRLYQSLNVREIADQSSGGMRTSRIHIRIDKLFDTGMNVVLYGDAGAGKTTTLDMYAMKIAESSQQEWLPLYLPLTKIVGSSSAEKQTASCDALTILEDEIVKYFNTNNLATTKADFRNMLSKKSRVIFLLDGVDEVIRNTPWIVEAITKLQQSYTNSQLIISSRISGSHLDHINFLKLTLLPFDNEQLFKFISAWFDTDNDKVDLIKKHLSNNTQILNIVRTPLLATILCVLAENNVPLPTGELSLFKERLKLLLGHYDIHKGIKRQKSHHDLLEIVARKIAFGLQSKTKRMLRIDDIKAISINALSSKYGKAEIELAVDELCDPCNILVPMSIQGEWGFGHLRYQEHLVAEELVRNRGIEIEPLLNSSWWKSVLVLFAQMTDDFENIFSGHILTTGHIGDAADTLQAMIAVRPKKERNELLLLLKQHKVMDALDPDESDLEFNPNY